MKLKNHWATRYSLALAIVVAAILARLALVPVMGLNVPYVTIYPAIMIVAVALGAGPGVFAALVGIVLAEQHLMHPDVAFHWDLSLATRSAIVLGASLYIGWIGRNLRSARAKAETEAATARVSEAALREAKDFLEVRVRERTAELERARTAVDAERQRLYAVLETLPVYVILLNDDYRVPFANRFFEERFGKSGGKRCYEYLFNRSEPCENCETFKVLETRAPHHWYWTGPDGRNYDIYDFPFKDTDGSMMIMEMGIDITETKKAQAALQELNVTLEQRVAERTTALAESEARVRRKLDSVLSPEGDLGALELSDIIDVPAVRALMDDFYKLSRFPLTIMDLKGQVLVGFGWQDICMHFHRAHPDACRNCIESDLQLTVGVPPGEARLYKCKNNMWDIATPILVGGRHVGNVFSGQFFFDDEKPDVDLFRAQARQYGFNETEYLAAMEAVPRFSLETVNTGMAFLMKLTNFLSLLSYGNIKLARLLGERDSLLVSIRQSEQRLNRAQEIAHLGSWDLDLAKNRLSWSDEVYRIFGLQPQGFDATYEAFLDRVHPEDRAAVNEAYSSSLRENRDRYEIEHRIVRKDTGEIRFVHEKCEHFHDAEGRIVRSVGMVQDITERKQAEEEIRRVNENLEQFAYVASHDLQEPLRIMASYSQLLEKRYKSKLDKDGDEFIGFIVDAAGRMQKLITDLLAYSRAGHKNIEVDAVDCNQLVRRVEKSLGAALQSTGGSIVFDKLPVIRSHEAALSQVFQNLIANALKFRGQEPPRVHVSAERAGNGWVFSVRDNGIGIERQYFDRIFAIFQRLHAREKYEGTGIGLSICKKIVESLGGRIWVKSEVGHGTTFFFTIPDAGAEYDRNVVA